MCTTCMPDAPGSQKRVLTLLKQIVDVFEPPRRSWEQKSDLLQQQWVLLTFEPSPAQRRENVLSRVLPGVVVHPVIPALERLREKVCDK